MNRTRAVVVYLLRRRRLRRQRRQCSRTRRQRRQCSRTYWAHPINERRDEAGVFATLYQELRHDDDKFFRYFRMSMASFDELLEKIKNIIQLEDTNMRNCIKPELRLAATLK
ncbi:hypothetical protein QE152_g1634 [Popillia japonica]|uniref:Uncharacterized protein n=1 Tax=Popillia japonica TaxID=7064 RepID=A0AAW1N6Y8_POPJA